jgi:hypothetical protein
VKTWEQEYTQTIGYQYSPGKWAKATTTMTPHYHLLVIPDYPSLRGHTIYFTAVAFSNGHPSSIYRREVTIQ